MAPGGREGEAEGGGANTRKLTEMQIHSRARCMILKNYDTGRRNHRSARLTIMTFIMPTATTIMLILQS